MARFEDPTWLTSPQATWCSKVTQFPYLMLGARYARSLAAAEYSAKTETVLFYKVNIAYSSLVLQLLLLLNNPNLTARQTHPLQGRTRGRQHLMTRCRENFDPISFSSTSFIRGWIISNILQPCMVVEINSDYNLPYWAVSGSVSFQINRATTRTFLT